jgi:hypothetical protein
MPTRSVPPRVIRSSLPAIQRVAPTGMPLSGSTRGSTRTVTVPATVRSWRARPAIPVRRKRNGPTVIAPRRAVGTSISPVARPRGRKVTDSTVIGSAATDSTASTVTANHRPLWTSSTASVQRSNR